MTPGPKPIRRPQPDDQARADRVNRLRQEARDKMRSKILYQCLANAWDEGYHAAREDGDNVGFTDNPYRIEWSA